jgi:hypothetical protein
MAKKGGTETVSQSLDPQSQAYVNRMRLAGQAGADAIGSAGPMMIGPDGRPISEQIAPYMNAFTQGVIDPTRAEFDYLRGQASRGVTDAAIRSNAYGGSRHGVAEGVRMAGIDRAQATTISDLFRQAHDSSLAVGLPHIEHQRQLRERQAQEPLFRALQQMGILNMGMGPAGTVQTKETEQGWGPQLFGGLLSIASMIPGPQQIPAGIARGAMGSGSAGGALPVPQIYNPMQHPFWMSPNR